MPGTTRTLAHEARLPLPDAALRFAMVLSFVCERAPAISPTGGTPPRHLLSRTAGSTRAPRPAGRPPRRFPRPVRWVIRSRVDVLAPRETTAPTPSTSREATDRKSTRLNSSHGYISYAVFCLKKKKIRTGLVL